MSFAAASEVARCERRQWSSLRWIHYRWAPQASTEIDVIWVTPRQVSVAAKSSLSKCVRWGERARSLELHDFGNPPRRPDFRHHADLGREVLEQKSDATGIPVRSRESIQASPTFSELEVG